MAPCQNDRDYQISGSVLESHWILVEGKKKLYNAVYLSLEEKAPVAGMYFVC